MWRLERESAGGPTHHFLTGTDYVVGRKNCSILIEDDPSISRAHATFSVSHPPSSLGQPDIIPVLKIKESSKYGTFINGEKMETGSSGTLHSGDKITFGVYNSKFRVIYQPLVACSSCLNVSQKSSLTQSLLMLGGHVVNNWTEKCTHLVMTSVKVTIKTLCALICCRSIIKPEYFSEMSKAIQQKKPLPAAESFFPIIDEPSLQSESLDLSENPKRRTVFKDKTFLFLTAKQHKKLGAAVHLGAGKTKLLTAELDDKSLLENPNVCVIDAGGTDSQSSESPDFPTWITSTVDVLQSKGLRTIPEAEIGLAVIYVSTEIYCNPLQDSANRNQAEKNCRQNIVGSTQSSSMAIDETVLPAATFNTTAYVADTEPRDHTDKWMDVSGVREVRETPKSNRRSSKTNLRKDQDVEAGASSDCRTTLFPEPPQERPRPPTQTEGPGSHRQRVSQKVESSNKIQNYFQPASKKRDREEEEGETSTSKLCRIEKVSSQFSQPTKEIEPPNQKTADLAPRNVQDTHKEPPGPSGDRLGNWYGQERAGRSTTSQPKDSLVKKRKEPEDVVEESDIEEEDERDDEKRDKKNTKSNISLVKRPRVETIDDFGEDFDAESLETIDKSMALHVEEEDEHGNEKKGKSNTKSNQGKRPRAETRDDFGEDFDEESLETIEKSMALHIEDEDEHGNEKKGKSNTKSNQGKRPRAKTRDDFGEDFDEESLETIEKSLVAALTVQTIKTEPDIKQEPISQHEDTKGPFRLKQENDDEVPSRLLLSEFRTLVVSRPARNSQTTSKAHQENGANFKKFRKIAYPGAGSFPHIIGGSDLVAHDRKKNSELEQWLRQEMEVRNLERRIVQRRLHSGITLKVSKEGDKTAEEDDLRNGTNV